MLLIQNVKKGKIFFIVCIWFSVHIKVPMSGCVHRFYILGIPTKRNQAATNLVTVEPIQCCLSSQSSTVENVDLITDEPSKYNAEEHRPVETSTHTIDNFK